MKKENKRLFLSPFDCSKLNIPPRWAGVPMSPLRLFTIRRNLR